MTCFKVKYADEKSAREDIKRIKKSSSRTKVPTDAYFCPDCKGWHTTSTAREELYEKLSQKDKEIVILKTKIFNQREVIKELFKLKMKVRVQEADIKRLEDLLRKTNSSQVAKFNKKYKS